MQFFHLRVNRAITALFSTFYVSLIFFVLSLLFIIVHDIINFITPFLQAFWGCTDKWVNVTKN